MNNNKIKFKSRKASAKIGNLYDKAEHIDPEKSELNEKDLCFRVGLSAYGEYSNVFEDWPDPESYLIELND